MSQTIMLPKVILFVYLVTTVCSAEQWYRFSPTDESENVAQQQTENNDTEIIFTESNVSKFQQSLRMFSAVMFNKVAEEKEKHENIFFSPSSIFHAMGMLNSGARGNTSTQIKRALRVKNNKENAFVDALMNQVTKEMFTIKNDSKVNTLMASRSFYKPGYKINDKYVTSLTKYYHSGMEETDFSQSDIAAKRINSWVENKTNDLIKDLVSPDIFTSLTRMVLVNALYFKAPWNKGFQMTYSPRTFMAPSGNINLLYMKGQMEYKVEDTGDVIHVAIPYADMKTYFIINMPTSESAMRNFTEKLALSAFFKTLKKRLRKWESKKISLFMPPFSIEKDMDVQKVLKTMKVTDLFSESKADLSGISEEFVYITDFLHKAKIVVDKDGTEAAAASAAVASARTIFRGGTVNINKPFIFSIYQDGNILFMGRVANPTT